jgi:hypothetical protein
VTHRLQGLDARATLAASLALTLALIGTVQPSWLLVVVLPLQWWLILRPISRREWLLFGIVGLFFTAQNHVALRSGVFTFRQQDFLLMPFHEPLLWMCWYLHIVRFVGEPPRTVRLCAPAWAGLLVTAGAFSAFGGDPRVLSLATLASCALLLAFFHSARDLAYAACALSLGLAVEWVGVLQGLWWYPRPDFLGLPAYAVTMWLSVGLLGRRFAVPLAEWIERRWAGAA